MCITSKFVKGRLAFEPKAKYAVYPEMICGRRLPIIYAVKTVGSDS